MTFALPGSKAAPKVLSAPAVSCGSFALAPQDLDGGARATQVDGQNSISCVHADRRVRFSLAVLTRPVRQGKLLGLERRMIDPEKWSRLRVHQTSATIEGQAVPIQAEWIGFGDAHRLVWSLFWADGAWRKAGIDTLWADLRADLAGRRRAVLVEISSDDSSDEQKTAAILQKFLAGLPLQQLVASSFGSGEH